MEVCARKLCIRCATPADSTGEPTIDACCWPSSSSGRRARAAHGGWTRASARRRLSAALFLAVAASRSRCCCPSERERRPAAARRPGRRLRAGLARPLRVRQLATSCRSSSSSCRCSCSLRCRTCRCWWPLAAVLSHAARLHRRQLAPRAAGQLLQRLLVLPSARCWCWPGSRPASRARAHRRSTSLAFGAQLAFDLAWTSLARPPRSTRLPFREILDDFVGIVRVRRDPDAARVRGHARRGRRAARPARDRPARAGCSRSSPATARERYADALELQRAYRGTVMLLSDVVEFDDQYTADHCRSVVDLAARRGRRARHRPARAPGARVRGPAARRRQDRDPEGDPQQAGRAHRRASSR